MTLSLDLLETQRSDSDQLLQLIHHFYQHFNYPYIEAEKRQTLESLWQNPTFGRIYFIQSERNIIGYVYLSFYFSLEFGGRTAFIDELFVLPSYRGLGIGSCVIEQVEQQCRAWQFRALHLESERNNTGATALYLKLGFLDYDRRLLTKQLA